MGSAISVGLLLEGKPVLGVVYGPLTPRGADCLALQLGRGELRRNGIAITGQLATMPLDGSVVFVSAAAKRHLELNDELCAPARCEPMPSIAYRLARVAAGDGVAAISLFPVSPRDVAAGHALLRAVGGELPAYHLRHSSTLHTVG
ncbi:inositol monophosphatase family protein [Pseudomonas panipatensis]|uniref:inositol monophosphatase family protein n=1 Tax=Pseudomonas panipatensis TaxID=428992 RepID=UPI000B7FCF75|nr:inositol monophosphatase family protein [Pseudomonas panipatensis]